MSVMSRPNRMHRRFTLAAAAALSVACVLALTAALPAAGDPPHATVVGTIPVTGVTDFAVGPGGGSLYVLDDHAGTVQFIDAKTGSTTATVSVIGNFGGHTVHLLGHDVLIGGIDLGKDPGNVVVSPDGKRLYIDTTHTSDNLNGNRIVVVDTATAKVISAYTVPVFPWDLTINPNGKYAYSLNFSACTVDVVDLSSPAPGIVKSTSLGTPGCNLPQMRVSSSGRRGYVSNGVDGIVQLDLTKFPPTVVKTIAADKPYHLAVSHDTHTLYATVNAPLGGVSVLNVDSGKLVGTIDTGPVGELITTANPALGFFTLPSIVGVATAVDLEHNKVLYTIPVGSQPTALGMSPSGGRLYVANADSNSISVVSVPQAQQGTGTSTSTPPATTGATPASSATQSLLSAPAVALSPLALALVAVIVVLLVGLIIIVALLRRRRST